jgi:hypothetical protein
MPGKSDEKQQWAVLPLHPLPMRVGCSSSIAPRSCPIPRDNLLLETEDTGYDFLNKADPSMICHVPNYLPLLRNSHRSFRVALRGALAISY